MGNQGKRSFQPCKTFSLKCPECEDEIMGNEDDQEFYEKPDGEEGREAKVATDPGSPTAEEVAKHNISH